MSRHMLNCLVFSSMCSKSMRMRSFISFVTLAYLDDSATIERKRGPESVISPVMY